MMRRSRLIAGVTSGMGVAGLVVTGLVVSSAAAPLAASAPASATQSVTGFDPALAAALGCTYGSSPNAIGFLTSNGVTYKGSISTNSAVQITAQCFPAGATVTFELNNALLGTAVAGSNGLATITYNFGNTALPHALLLATDGPTSVSRYVNIASCTSGPPTCK